MVNLDMAVQHFEFAHSVEGNAAFVVMNDSGLCALVIINVENKDNGYFCSCVLLWEDGNVVISSIEEEFEIIEEWCFNQGYKLGKVYASDNEYTISIGEKTENVF